MCVAPVPPVTALPLGGAFSPSFLLFSLFLFLHETAAISPPPHFLTHPPPHPRPRSA